jgi:DNA-binding LacI/PurR family transcriptional regulator
MAFVEKGRAATLIDVARQARVGKTTASDALSGTGRVSAATRDAVLKAAHDLGYRPNNAARALRNATTGTIALYIPEAPTRSSYYMAFVFGVLEFSAQRDYDVTVITGSAVPQRERIPRVDGLIVADPFSGDRYAQRLLESGLPTVSAEHALEGAHADAVVYSQHERAMRQLLDHLYESGARRPALIVPGGESDWASAITRGYTGWCDERGVSTATATVPYVPTGTQMEAATDVLLERHPELDSLVCAPADTAGIVLRHLRKRGRIVGGDLLLAACTDSPTMMLADPAITAIDSLPREAGMRCAELLFDLMSGNAEPGAEVEIPYRIEPRASSARLLH